MSQQEDTPIHSAWGNVTADTISFSGGGKEVLRITSDGKLIFTNADEAAKGLDEAWSRIRNADKARIEALEEALKPFVRHYAEWMDRFTDDEECATFARVTFGDLRRARAALGGSDAAS